MAAATKTLKQWMQKNQVFDKDLLRLFPKYGVVDPDKDLCNLAADKWNELQQLLLTEKRAELKDQAANLRFAKKIDKITKLWKEARSAHKPKRSSAKRKKSAASSSSANKAIDTAKSTDAATATVTATHTASNSTHSSQHEEEEKRSEIEQLRVENKRIRRELSSRNSDYTRLLQEFNVYKKEKDEELKKMSSRLNAKSEDYENLLKQYKQINQRVNSKYHEASAKDKEISSLKTDKSALLNDINEVMKGEQERYDQLMQKYLELKEMNNRNLKYKLRYKAQKGRDRDGKHKTKNYTVDLNAVDIEKIHSMDLDVVDDVLDYVEGQHQGQEEMKAANGVAALPSNASIDEDLLRLEASRPKKFKPSKEKRARARQLSDIVTSKQRQKNRMQAVDSQKKKEND